MSMSGPIRQPSTANENSVRISMLRFYSYGSDRYNWTNSVIPAAEWLAPPDEACLRLRLRRRIHLPLTQRQISRIL